MPNSWTRHLEQHEDRVFLVLTLVIGAVVGLVVVAFIVLTGNLGARMYPPGGSPWRRLLVPAAGSLVTGYLLCAFTVPMALAAIPGGWLSDRAGYRVAVVAGLVVAVAGFWMMSRWKTPMASQAVSLLAPGAGAGVVSSDIAGVVFMAAGLALAGIGIGLTIAPIGTAVINGVGEGERGMAASLVIILRLVGMSVSMSSMTAYGLRRTTVLGRQMLGPEDALDLEKTARVALEVVTKITGEIALIALAVTVMALGVAMLLRRGDLSPQR